MRRGIQALLLSGLMTLLLVSPALAINCVEYVRWASDFKLSGNAWQWWRNAVGQYERGGTPAPGAVLVFKNQSKMRSGHVALVRDVIDHDTVLIDHANWASARAEKGRVDKSVQVRDCSAKGDWSAVCVWNSKHGVFGRPYPVFGFIYGRQPKVLPPIQVAQANDRGE